MRIWVALSGGVDSAVAASIALEAGADVTGVTLDLGIDAGSIVAAADVASALGIVHHVIDAHQAFEESVVTPFVQAYVSGSTPNPCVACNEYIKLGLLLDHACRAGAHRLFTGHYARVAETAGGLRIARAADPLKDQSYFLYRVSPQALGRLDFPLGTLTKVEVRARAAALGLQVAERADSQDVCFLGGMSAGEFARSRMPDACVSGPVLDGEGRLLGTHPGLCHYTVGQRKGLPGGAGPLFVIGIDPGRNAVIAGSRRECETTRVVAADAVWSGADARQASVCVRARSAAVPATVVRSGDRLVMEFVEPVCAAPGQAAVCYDGDVVIGGGTIVKEHIA